jgi:hypothetical protein
MIWWAGSFGWWFGLRCWFTLSGVSVRSNDLSYPMVLACSWMKYPLDVIIKGVFLVVLVFSWCFSAMFFVVKFLAAD